MNQWREENPNIKPDLSKTNLSGADLSRTNLSEAKLSLRLKWQFETNTHSELVSIFDKLWHVKVRLQD